MLAKLLPARTAPAAIEERFSLDQYVQMLFDGNRYLLQQTAGATGKGEPVGTTARSYINVGYRQDSVVFACISVRQLLFSQIRFKWRSLRTGDLFGNPDLDLLDRPNEQLGMTRQELLARMELYASLAGNAFVVRRKNTRGLIMPPPWECEIVHASDDPADPQIMGLVWKPGGPGSKHDPVMFTPDEYAHYSPIPDPESPVRGMSWLQPIVVEIEGDLAASRHKKKFFENGATPNMVVTLGDQFKNPQQVVEFVEKLEEKHTGVANAYKTLYLSSGADVKVVGADLKQLDFKLTQGAGETRIAAAAGVPPVIVGLSEGLQAATYSNYSQARRRFADGTMWPLWQSACNALEHLLPVPDGAELWFDTSTVPFLRDDQKDEAEIRSQSAQTIKALVEAGYAPDVVVQAVTSGDLTRLVGNHTGLTSVQLQPPGAQQPAA